MIVVTLKRWLLRDLELDIGTRIEDLRMADASLRCDLDRLQEDIRKLREQENS